MTAFALKIIATICMSIDHIGAVFTSYTPDLFRWIGRIAFPLYVYLIAEGCMHTKNINKYMLRLGIFALISEIPFDLAFHQSYWIFRELPLDINFIRVTNVFYSFFLGVACVSIYEKLKLKTNQLFALIPLILPLIVVPYALIFAANPNTYRIVQIFYVICIIILSIALPNTKTDFEIKLKHKILAIIPALPLILLGSSLDTDYGMYAIALILVLYLVKTKRNRLIVLFCGTMYQYGIHMVEYQSSRNLPNILSLIFALFAVLLIFFYNGQQGRKLKWVFYWFYPIHIALLAFILILFVRPMLNGF